MKVTGLGETCCPEVGKVLIFDVGTFITRGKDCWVFVKECRCIQGKNGLENADGTPIDINYYCVKVTKKAKDTHINYCLKKQEEDK